MLDRFVHYQINIILLCFKHSNISATNYQRIGRAVCQIISQVKSSSSLVHPAAWARQQLAILLKTQKSGHIINTASVAAHLVFPASSVYSATKFSVRALTEGLRQESAAHNIRATLISPGAVKTELLEHITDQEVKAINQDYVESVGVSAETYARMVAFAISEPEDVGVSEIIFRPTAQEL